MLAILIALALGVVAAHLVGWRFSRALAVAPGHARDVMPALPAAPLMKGRAAVRWEIGLRRAEQRVLDAITGGAEAVHADALAARTSEDRDLVAAALERIREEIPCRMRVTRSGRILHDFVAEDVARLRRKRRRGRPFRAFVFLLAIGANLGAAWPVITILSLAIFFLDEVLTATEDPVEVGIGGIVLIAGVIVWALLFGFVFDLVLRPLARGPTLGRRRKAEEIPDRRDREARQSDAGEGGSMWAWFGGWSGSSGGSGGGSSGGDGDSDGGLGQAIIIIILIIVIAVCVTVLFFWIRGLWRAVTQRRPELDRLSPTAWVRTAEVVDGFERFIPTNDLVGRLSRAIRRAFVHRRPVDGDLGLRILARARSNRGRVSAVEVALHEALSESAAVDACSRLTGIVGGEILVTEDGDLAFRFPDHVLAEVEAAEDEDIWAEYVRFAQRGTAVNRRADQAPERLPLNFVGISWGHLGASSRLVAGSWLMPLTGWLVIDGAEGAWGSPLVWFLAAMAIGATVLAASARYVARALAIQGVRRDTRRALFQEVIEALREGRDRVNLGAALAEVSRTMRIAWPRLSDDDVLADLEAAACDLDLAPSAEHGPERFELPELRARLARAAVASAEGVEGLPEQVELPFESEDDPVVFDTQVTHERVVALA